jgi:phospholipid N-methyltransferase
MARSQHRQGSLITMQTITEYRLDFCTIHHRDDGIAVIEIDEGVNLNANMADELAELTRKVLGSRPLALLSNRINSYSLSFEALSTLAKLPNLIALAITTYNKKTKLLVETQNFFLSHLNEIPVKIFTNMDNAEEWLKEILEQHSIDQP